jgi:hypothetical protein
MQQQQEQLRKMRDDYLHRVQMHVYYESQQKKKTGGKGFYSCSVCGSVIGLKACPMCKRLFCGVHLSSVKTGLGGHVCVSNQPSSKFVKPQVSLTPSVTKVAGKAKSEKLVDLNLLVDWFSKLARDIPLTEDQDMLFNYLLAKLRQFPDDSLDWLDWIQEYEFKTG